MKNLIVTTVLIVLGIFNVKGQNLTYKMSAFYRFSHEPYLTTFTALNSDMETFLGKKFESVVLNIDVPKNTLTMNYLDTQKSESYVIKDVDVLSDLTTLYVVTKDGKDVTFTVTQNTPTEMLVLCVWVNDENKYEGWQSVVE